jgi:hypothetical protein
VPFFFLLSGFVLFFSKAQAEGSSVQKAREFGFTGKGKAWLWLWKRWVAVYPLFLLSLVLGVWGVPLFAHPHGQWMELLNMLLMLQAWAEELRCTDTTTLCVYVVWNEPAWFVSALFWCWLTFPFAYRQLHRMGFYSVCLCGGLLYAISCWELVVWPNLPAELLLQADRIGAITARNPLANANKFLLGAVLGRLLLLRCQYGCQCVSLVEAAAVAVDEEDRPLPGCLLLAPSTTRGTHGRRLGRVTWQPPARVARPAARGERSRDV